MTESTLIDATAESLRRQQIDTARAEYVAASAEAQTQHIRRLHDPNALVADCEARVTRQRAYRRFLSLLADYAADGYDASAQAIRAEAHLEANRAVAAAVRSLLADA